MAVDSVKAPAEILIPPTIARALIKIQKTLKPMMKTAANDLYGSGYFPPEDVADKAFELLAAEGIGVTQPLTSMSDGGPAIETILFHRKRARVQAQDQAHPGKERPTGSLSVCHLLPTWRAYDHYRAHC